MSLVGGIAKMVAALGNIGNYEERRVANDMTDKLELDTAYTTDEGYETAICYEGLWHPVERYVTKEDAVTGHNKWKEKLPTLTEITDLGGFDGLVEPEVIKIV